MIVCLLMRLRAMNVKVWKAPNGRVNYDPPLAELDEGLRAQLLSRESEIVDYLINSDDCEHTTQYIQMRDGVRLAADLFRPKRDGTVLSGPLPVIWCHDRYGRSLVEDGLVWTKLDTRPWLRAVLRRGYVIAAVDARGTGASTGVRRAEFSAEETQDAYDVTEWFADQPWCNGRVGMHGDSYLAVAQLLAASAAPPHLYAIFPDMPLFDLYSFVYPGGVFRHDFVARWADVVRERDTGLRVVPVAGEADVAAQAAEQHKDNDDVLLRAKSYPYRDSRADGGDRLPYQAQSPASAVDAINASGVPVYLLSGWFDIWVRDCLLWFENLTNPRKMMIGNVAHNSRQGMDLETEYARWYDYWLKGVDNGVMDEPPIRYWTINAPPGQQWRTVSSWPPPETEATTWYFHEGPSGSVESVNDGHLREAAPPRTVAPDEYIVDYTTSTGRSSRWAQGYGAPFGYPPLNDNDCKALTYTTDVLAADLEVTGHPIVHLYVACTHPDGDFFVYLEDVDEGDVSNYVTEGVLRASHRRLGDPPYRSLELPYPISTEAAVEELPSLPVELVIDMHPTSYIFAAGHRVRVTVTGCDRDNADTPVQQPAPMVTLYRHGIWASRVVLPIMPPHGRGAGTEPSPSLEKASGRA